MPQRSPLLSGSAMNRVRPLLPLLMMACLLGCKTSASTSLGGLDGSGHDTLSGDFGETGFEAWAAGDEDAAGLDAPDDALAIEALFMQAEIDFWAGDVERAFERHAALIRTYPSSPLVRFCAARINDLSDDVVDYEQRVDALLGQVTFGEVHPLAASYLSLAGQDASLSTWRSERPATPFTADASGLPVTWQHTPLMSPFRLADFDTPFLPETQPQLAASYLSPFLAENVPLNQKPTYPYISSNTSLSPDLGTSGIYYLETFATVTASSAQTYWLHTNFSSAARLWIDGVEVIERQEDHYDSGRRWRRIKLAPGTHRVLLKLAYQSNYRDWFDLAFLNKNATLSGGSQMTFSKDAPDGYLMDRSGLTLLSDTRAQTEIDPFILRDEQLEGASDAMLYLAALAAHYDRDGERFDAAYDVLVARRPEFAAAYALKSMQVRTLWELPTPLRDDAFLKMLRRAHQLHPQSIRYNKELGTWLNKKGESREVEALFRQASDEALASDGRLRNVGALSAWAAYLEGEGWNELAEKAYVRVLEASPSHCGAASSLQTLWYARELYLTPAQISPAAAKRCPSLRDAWLATQPESYDEKLEITRVDALRFPYSSNYQLAYVRELEARGKSEQAEHVLRDALSRTPWQRTLVEELVDRAYTTGGEQAALAVLDTYEEAYTNFGWMVWKRANLTGKLPLTDLMMDARAIAVALAKKEPVSAVGSAEQTANSAGDEAFYVIDFAAKQYYDDGTGVQLTHTLVRVMTKNAIDRFGELSVPGGARLIHARTIKQDGSVQTPVNVSGKDTLSMPGLAEGDFVELAYLDYDSSPTFSRTQREGTKFFFKMQGISSLNSEYVIINPSGEVLRFNGAPEGEEFVYEGVPALRFVRKDSPRPRNEPSQLTADEFLPWVQLVREGSTMDTSEIMRAFVRDQFLDSMRLSASARRTIRGWLASTKAESRDGQVKQLYYTVTEYFTSVNMALGRDVSHAIVERDGNPMLALKAAYDTIGVESQLFMMRSEYAGPVTHPMFAIKQYSDMALRVRMPDSGKVVWLTNFEKDAMFGSIMPYNLGQPALCVSCEKPEQDTVPGQDVPTRRRDQLIRATLRSDGTLVGTVRQTYDGDFAQNLRELFRKRTETRQRDAVMGNLTIAYLPGATVTSYEIENLAQRDEPLVLTMEFEREQFARADGSGALLLEASLFSPAIEPSYATLPSRTTPMLVGRPMRAIDVLEITLPAGMKPSLRSPSGARTLATPFGTYVRSTTIEADKLIISSNIDMDIQRISAQDYPAFQTWAQQAEQSAVILLRLDK